MKIISRLPFILFLCIIIETAHTQSQYQPNPNTSVFQDDENESLKAIQVYLYNLGQYLGTPLGDAPQKNPVKSAAPLPFLELSATQITNTYIPAVMALTSMIDPSKIFKDYSSASSDEGNISANRLVDQAPYQTNPGAQSVLNILTTPDFSYCLPSYQATAFKGDPLSHCQNAGQQLTNLNVVTNVIGTLPGPTKFFTSNGMTSSENNNLIEQLSSNALLTPLNYSTDSQSGKSSSKQLTANSESQIAENFIRYASGTTVPMDLATWSQYESLLQAASGSKTSLSTQQAKYTLAQYLSSLRTYAAQTSVGINNLYYILSKRIKNDSTTASEALSEYNMATWRLANVNQNSSAANQGSNDSPQQQKQWAEQIKDAPPETVQKEIALLLAEMNYQLYLTRQQQERLLLTNSILVIQSARSLKPSLLGADTIQDQSDGTGG